MLSSLSSDDLFLGGVVHSQMDTRDEMHFRYRMLKRNLGDDSLICACRD